jgi:hypothetical protein
MNTAARTAHGLVINPDPAREQTWSKHGKQNRPKSDTGISDKN